MITTTDGWERLEDYVMSGFTPPEQRRIVEWPGNMNMFERLRDPASPVRVADMSGYLDALGSRSLR